MRHRIYAVAFRQKSNGQVNIKCKYNATLQTWDAVAFSMHPRQRIEKVEAGDKEDLAGVKRDTAQLQTKFRTSHTSFFVAMGTETGLTDESIPMETLESNHERNSLEDEKDDEGIDQDAYETLDDFKPLSDTLDDNLQAGIAASF
ncbi:hypothetical protein RND71_026767 [Anisodus tanguticus]|uniref:Uncharacterized protein n=1 Tax=Anisodus tanguticus TaxID=243964 RepID=A0AAE1RPI5_9SOLA|nr:hypothetical protein RND71_026767 [Anisodus tanguticus]